MNKWSVCFAFVFVVACGSKKESAPAEKSSKDKPATEKTEVAKKPAADLFTGKTVTLPEPIAKLKFGMSEADAKAASPDVLAEKYSYKPPGYDGVEISVQINDGQVYQPRIKIKEPIETVKGWLAAKWGEPRAAKNAIGSPEYYWDAPDVGLSAKLEDTAGNCTVRFDPVTSIEAVLGSDPKVLGGDRIPTIGASQEDFMKAFAPYNPIPRKDDAGSITAMSPRIAGDDGRVYYDVRIKGGKVTGYHLSVPSAFNDVLLAKLEGSFGKGKPSSIKLYTDFKGPPKAKAEIRKEGGSGVWIGDAKK
jgi:hypothetical protein